MISLRTFLGVVWTACFTVSSASRAEAIDTWRRLQVPLDDVLVMDSELSLFMEAVNRISDESFRTMMSAAPYTLFAPVNEAFAGLSEAEMGYLNRLINEPNWGLHLQNWIEYHFTYSAFFQIENITTNPTEVFMWNRESTFAQQIEYSTNEVLWNPSWTRAVGIVNSSQPIASGDGSVAYKLAGFLTPQFYNISIADIGTAYPEYAYTSDLLVSVWESFFSDPNMVVTVLAPSMDAWMALGMERLEFLNDEANRDELERLLYHHILLSLQPTTLLQNGQVLDTMSGTPLTVTVAPAVDLVSANMVSFDGAVVTRSNVLAINGILHEIDRVLDVQLLSTAAPTTNPPVPQSSTMVPTNLQGLPQTAAPFVPLETTGPSFAPAPSVGSNTSYLDGESDLSKFTAALARVGLKAELESGTNISTLFAPVNRAVEDFNQTYWTKLQSPNYEAHLRNLLEFHVIEGITLLAADLTDDSMVTMRNNETATIVASNSTNVGLIVRNATNMTNVTVSDVVTDFGLLHKIDSVLSPAFVEADFKGALESGLEILFDLMGRAGLAESLDTSEWTLLSPTNDAFFALGVETLERLIDPVNARFLRGLMTAHMVNTVYPLEFLVDGMSIASFGGLPISVSVSGSEVLLNGTTILEDNVLVRNGIIHTIDQVLGTLNFDAMSVTADSESEGDMQSEASSATVTMRALEPLVLCIATLLATVWI